MFAVVASLAVSASASGAPDRTKVLASLARCGPEGALASLGEIQRVEAVGSRSPDTIVQLTGAKARAYAIFDKDSCEVLPIIGKPAAYAKGNFGAGAVTAYALVGARCTDDSACHAVVSLKSKDDAVIDVFVLPQRCENGMTLARRTVFSGRDSLELGCSTSSGADTGRTDYLLDAGRGMLSVLLTVEAGVGWLQVPDDGSGPRCKAKIPGGFAIVTKGASPKLDVTTPATPDEAAAANVEHQSGGCDVTVATRRFVLDRRGTAFVATSSAPRVTTRTKFCQCWAP